jgi:hypothetical protein
MSQKCGVRFAVACCLIPWVIPWVTGLQSNKLSAVRPPSSDAAPKQPSPPLWDLPPVPNDTVGRRSLFEAAFVAGTALVSSTLTLPVWAQEENRDGDLTGDLTSQLFNPDGSLKEGIASEAKFRTVRLSIDASAERVVCIDGKSSGKGSRYVQVLYDLPVKWEDGDNLYVDRSEGINAKACDRITVYQAPDKVPASQLEKATKIGIAKALDVIDELGDIGGADLIGGRIRRVGDQKYYEFDLGVAPKTCGDSQDNLGLGFCPFESIYLFSSTILDDRLYVFCMQSTKSQWKRANADQRRVRSTFTVTSD